MSLSEIPTGARVFVEASVFLSHFAGTSRECRLLLERCERADVRGVTSALALATVAHGLMALEEAAQTPTLTLHEEAVARIPLMGVEVLPLDLRAVLLGGSLRRASPLKTLVSLDLAVARAAGAEVLATADAGRGVLEGLRVCCASDLA